jgi:predicted Ser/Thr protein kinase/tetratricopeptide (TPR) repeat protein
MIAPPGFQVGPYTVLGNAGRGGMADVFAASDTRSGRRVALKLVPIGDDSESRHIVEAEREGAEYQKQLWQVYRQVPEVYEYGNDDSYFYIAMEFLEGQNLSELISRGPMPAARAVGIAIQICRFLEAAHTLEPMIDGRKRRSLLHGDLKPRNIRVLADDQVKVFDFGAAKSLSYSRKVTRHDFGSIAYLSPERIESGEIDAHADFWGLGVILYEMVSGVQPFQANDTRRLEARIRARTPLPPLDAGCPAALQAVVGKLLAGAQQDRYGSAQAIREDLESVLADRATVAAREGWPSRRPDEPPTRRLGGDEEATRRTVRSATVKEAPAAASHATAGVASGASKRRHFFTRPSLRSVLLLLVLIIVARELRVSALANRLADDVAVLELSELDDAWARYHDLHSGTLGIGVMGLERALMRQTLSLADRVIANYRTPTPSVREAQWRAARGALTQALSARRDDSYLKALIRYCDGHLHRIDGEARKGRKLLDEAQHEFADALVAFREAAQLQPEWADPYLGLMRTFIYGLDDVERGEDALAQAVRRGYKSGDRETAQLAEGHRLRAETLVRSARELSGMSQELEYLNRAIDEYRKSLDFYSKVPTLGNTVRQMRTIQRQLAATEERITSLTAPPPVLPAAEPAPMLASPMASTP